MGAPSRLVAESIPDTPQLLVDPGQRYDGDRHQYYSLHRRADDREQLQAGLDGVERVRRADPSNRRGVSGPSLIVGGGK